MKPASPELMAWTNRLHVLLRGRQRRVPEPEPERGPDLDEAALGDAEAYRGALLRMLRQLKAQPLNIGIALGKLPEEHRVLLHRSTAGRQMAAALQRATASTLLTWGRASAHPERDNTFVLDIEGRQLGRLKSRLEAMLKAFNPQPFSKVQLKMLGQEVDEAEADEGDEAAPVRPATSSTAPDPIATLKAEGLAALEALEAAHDPDAFGRAVESLRIRADLLADLHGDKVSAAALISRAMDCVRRAHDEQAFELQKIAQLGKLTDRAFKFGVLKGGLLGGGLEEERLQAAEAGCAEDPVAAMAQWELAFELATKTKNYLACAESLYRMARRREDPHWLGRAAVLMRSIRNERMREVGQEYAEAAQKAEDPSLMLNAAGNLLNLGVDDESLVSLVHASTSLAHDKRDAPSLRGGAELLIDVAARLQKQQQQQQQQHQQEGPAQSLLGDAAQAAQAALRIGFEDADVQQAWLALGSLSRALKHLAAIDPAHPELAKAAKIVGDASLDVCRMAMEKREWPLVINAAHRLGGMGSLAAAGDAIRTLLSTDPDEDPDLAEALLDAALVGLEIAEQLARSEEPNARAHALELVDLSAGTARSLLATARKEADPDDVSMASYGLLDAASLLGSLHGETARKLVIQLVHEAATPRRRLRTPGSRCVQPKCW